MDDLKVVLIEALEKLQDELEEERQLEGIDIVISPPNDGDETEEDSGPEDCCDPDKLSSQQLTVGAEVFVKKMNDDNLAVYHEINESLEEEIQAKKKTKITNWKKNKVFIPNETLSFAPRTPPLVISDCSHPLDFFKLFCTPEIVNECVSYVNGYASKKNDCQLMSQ